MSLVPVVLSVLALAMLGTGYTFAFRVESALAFQRRYAEALSSTPPSETPGYYEETREHRKTVFRVGGVVLLVVGCLVLAAAVYGAFVAGPSA
jgi:hypothetical protein